MSRHENTTKRFAGLVAIAVGGVACNGVVPRVRSVSPTRVFEGRSTTLTIDTEGCAPRVDIDRGVRIGDDAGVRLDGGEAMEAMRLGPEAFSLQLPETTALGSYVVDLQLDDGRVAHFDSPIEVVPLDPVIAAIESTRGSLSFGETAIPFTVTLRNDSQCGVDGLNVMPTFRQMTTTLPLTFRGPATASLAPRSSMELAYEVDLDTSVTAEMLSVDVTATGGTRTGSAGCTGGVDATNDAGPFSWFVVPASRQTIAVTGLQYSPPNPRSGQMLTIGVTVRNDTGTDITMERLDVQSTPAGVVGSEIYTTSRTLTPGASQGLSVMAMLPEVATRSEFYVWVAASARDGQGMVYNSSPRAAATTIVVLPQR